MLIIVNIGLVHSAEDTSLGKLPNFHLSNSHAKTFQILKSITKTTHRHAEPEHWGSSGRVTPNKLLFS